MSRIDMKAKPSGIKHREDNAYTQAYGDIPNTQVERIAYILGKRASNEKFNHQIQLEAKRIKRIKKKTVKFTWYKIVKPSARPRANMRGGYVRMYVPRAAINGQWFEDFYKEHPELPYIDTPCVLDVTIYEKTPSSFSMKQKVIAELGIYRPWKRTGDFDNYAKTVADMMQHGMLEDDCLIVESHVSLKYSIKPRCEVAVTYMEKMPKI